MAVRITPNSVPIVIRKQGDDYVATIDLPSLSALLRLRQKGGA